MVLDLGGFADGFETSASPLCWRDPPESSLSDSEDDDSAAPALSKSFSLAPDCIM